MDTIIIPDYLSAEEFDTMFEDELDAHYSRPLSNKQQIEKGDFNERMYKESRALIYEAFYLNEELKKRI